jgi:hypothetical protein
MNVRGVGVSYGMTSSDKSMLEQLQEDVRRLCASGSRAVGSQGHAKARAYLLDRIAALGLQPLLEDFEAPYHRDGRDFVNLLASAPGNDALAAPILMAAHYDTCGDIPGADDNAAAIAIVLEVARRMREAPLRRPAIAAFFDAEEPPYYLTPSMGSIRYFEDQRPAREHCAIALDLCGHDVPIPTLEDLIFITGMESDPALPEVVRSCESSTDIRFIPTLNRYIGDLSDHHIYRVNKQPYLFFSCGRWKHYHAPTDTPDKLNYTKILAVADLLEGFVRELDDAVLDGPFESKDPVDTEIYFLEQTVGSFLEAFGFHPEDRWDVDQVARYMMSQFGL